MSRTTLRLGGAFGLSHVVVVIAGFALTGPTDTTPRAPIEDVLAFYSGDRLMRAFTGGYVELLGYLLFVPFVLCLVQHLRRHEGPDGIAALSALGLGAVYLAAVIGTGFGAGAAAMWTGTHAEAPAGVVALNSLRSFSYAASLAAFGAFLVAVAVSALVGRSLPKWLSISALVIGATLVAGIARFVDGWADIVALLGLAWIIAVSIWGLRGRQVGGSPTRVSELAAPSRV